MISCSFIKIIADSEGRAPLHWAVDRGHLNVTELLLSKGADINAKVKDYLDIL